MNSHVARAIVLLCLTTFGSSAASASEGCDSKHAYLSADVITRIGQYGTKLEHANQSGAILVGTGRCTIVEYSFGLSDRDTNKLIDADTLFDIGSITKQFTAAAILRLEVDGELRRTDRLGHFVPEAPASTHDISIHQLLTHTAGFPETIGDDYEVLPRDTFLRTALATELVVALGTEYRYSNVGYSLLAAIVETVAGTDYESYLREHLFDPAGMHDTGYRKAAPVNERAAVGYRGDTKWGKPTDQTWASEGPYWNLRGNGGLLSTTRDLYRWDIALRGDRVLPTAAIEAFQTPYVQEGPGARSHYAYGWAVFPTPRETQLVTHNGGNGVFFADLWRYPDEVAKTTELPRNLHGDAVWTLVQSIRDGGQEKLAALVEGGFSNQLRSAVAIDKHLAVLGSIGDEIGEVEVAGVLQSGDRTEVTFASGITLIVEFDGPESSLISGLGIED